MFSLGCKALAFADYVSAEEAPAHNYNSRTTICQADKLARVQASASLRPGRQVRECPRGASDSWRTCSLQHEVDLGRMVHDPGLVCAVQQLHYGTPTWFAVIESPLVHVHSYEFICQGSVQVSSILE